MSGYIQKWGNSLALRIPKAYADELQWGEETAVEIAIVDGRLLIKATNIPTYSLDELLDKMTPENLHSETKTGHEIGNEIW